MNQVSLHISYLLLTCRKVTVPGFGAFSACYEPASFDAEDGIFYPSRIRIIFDTVKKEESFVLLNSLKRKLQINEREAEEMINNFVVDVRKKLSKTHYCRLEGIGYLIDNKGSYMLKDTFWKRNKYPSLSTLQYNSAQIS